MSELKKQEKNIFSLFSTDFCIVSTDPKLQILVLIIEVKIVDRCISTYKLNKMFEHPFSK